jgi:hypothetical protein
MRKTEIMLIKKIIKVILNNLDSSTTPFKYPPLQLSPLQLSPYSPLPINLLSFSISSTHPTKPKTTQHNTTQHNTTQHPTTQHNTTQHYSTQHNTQPHNTQPKHIPPTQPSPAQPNPYNALCKPLRQSIILTFQVRWIYVSSIGKLSIQKIFICLFKKVNFFSKNDQNVTKRHMSIGYILIQ